MADDSSDNSYVNSMKNLPVAGALVNGASSLWNLFQGPPSLPPNMMPKPIDMGAYKPFFDATLAAAYDPQNQYWRNASNMANDSMKNYLAGRGILNSSAGDQAMAGVNNQLAQTWMRDNMNRQQTAFNTIGGFMNPAMQNNIAIGQNNNAYGWGGYNAGLGNMQRTQGAVQGLANSAGQLLGAYGSSGANNQAGVDFASMMNSTANSPSGQYFGLGSPNPYASPTYMPVGSTYGLSNGSSGGTGYLGGDYNYMQRSSP